ncbi:MAG TPA: hypothetical protein DCX89_07565 [Saprospirales bacterium]|nr:hypothetical protein [Saprospirales bacterium]HRQ31042.1 S41 family peptidase [Saprospiraceae bacterium]
MKQIFTILLLIGLNSLNGQPTELFDHLREGYNLQKFLCSSNTKDLNREMSDLLISDFRSEQLFASSDPYVYIGNYEMQIKSDMYYLLLKSPDKTASLYIEKISDKITSEARWDQFRKWKGIYSGINYLGNGFYYLKLDSLDDVSINATMRTDKYIIHLQKRLPGVSLSRDSLSEVEWNQFHEANTYLLKVFKMLIDHLVEEKEMIYCPLNGKLINREFTATERLVGFIDFWTEVKYNFAFFDQVPEVDWEKVKQDYIPKMLMPQSNTAYYKLLTEICARLNDGHTNVYYPDDLVDLNYYPNVELGNFEDGIYIINTSKFYRERLPLGSKILKVNNEPVFSYLQNQIIPYISASTDYIRLRIALENLTKIPEGEKLVLTYLTPDGTEQSYEFTNFQDTSSWINEYPEWSRLEFKALENKIAYLKINTFNTSKVVDDFVELKDTIGQFKKLIIDLRENGGGNSLHGYEILKYFAAKPFVTSKWKTREHKAVFKAWAEFVEEPAKEEMEKVCLLTAKGDFWYESPPDTIIPYKEKHISIPLIILTGNHTASAAEDFLIAADSAGFSETVGEYTFGSTGQPLSIRLPGGGSARICTKRDTYPDGREFVGYGIKPKYLVKPDIADVLKNHDMVLEFALRLR